MSDDDFMRRALALAARGRGNTSPNPMVGAVVVDSDGRVVGEGYHERAGSPHAEVRALDRAGGSARGATLYVTLEPCHVQGRTPPCVDTIVSAGIKRVVIAMPDPDPSERGEGIAVLRRAGITVDVGVRAAEAQQLNRAYARHRSTGRPFLTLKMAQSLDGAIGERTGTRRRLTGDAAARHVRALRYEHDAVMVGVGTVEADDPQLTVRPHRRRAVPYARIVVDSAARLALDTKLVKDLTRASTIVAATDAANGDRIAALEAAGVRVLVCESDGRGRVLLSDLMRRLGDLPMLGVLCEGGPTLAGSLLADGLVDELHWIVAPLMLGTAATAPAVAGLTRSVAMTMTTVRTLGEDLLAIGVPSSGRD